MISIIVPAYNLETLIGYCINSILNQSYKDFEVIIIDDGSSDSTFDVCKGFSKLDQRVHVYRKENSGPSDARNLGVEKSKGEYITFVDGDDIICVEYLNKLHSMIKKYQADISVLGFQIINKYEDIKETSNKNYKDILLNGEQAFELLLYEDIIHTSASSILIKRDLALKYPFPSRTFHEDDFTTYNYYLNSDVIVVNNEPLYCYLQRNGSIMHSFGQQVYDEIKAADNFYHVCMKNYIWLLEAALFKKFIMYFNVAICYPELRFENPDNFKRISLFIKKHRLQILVNKKSHKKLKLYIILSYFGFCLIRVLEKMHSASKF